MITAVDTSVLLDILAGDPGFGRPSAEALAESVQVGAVIVSPVVVAELRSAYRDDSTLMSALMDLRVRPVELKLEDALRAGAIQREYLKSGGQRSRVAADFLIGVHALNHADRLLTRDRGFFRDYFRELDVWYPQSAL